MPMTPRYAPPDELLNYLPEYRVVICTKCQYAIQPDAISRHLKEIHHILRGQRRPFMSYVSKLNLGTPEEVVHSVIEDFPVPLLPILDGLRCKNESCGYLCVSVKRMQSHWTSAHGGQGREVYDWRCVKLQTFFRGNLLKYFTDENTCILQMERNKPLQSVSTAHATILSSIDESPAVLGLGDDDTTLLRHFTTSTFSTIATNQSSQKLWQSTIPTLASTNPFLMHGLLAISALHRHHLSRSPHLLTSAAYHQSIALPLFREAVATPTAQNCHVLFAFSHLLTIISFASATTADEILFLVNNTNNDHALMPHWLYFLHSGCELLCHVWDDIEAGPLALQAAEWEVQFPLSRTYKAELGEHFLSFVPREDCRMGVEDDHLWTETDVEIYRQAAMELAWAFSFHQAKGDGFSTWDALRAWPMRIQKDFIRMLGRGHPGALVLLAHYCVLLKRLEENWYLEKRGTKLFSTVMGRLEEKWHWCLRWPLEEFGVSGRKS